MNLKEIGSIVSAHRVNLGMSQEQLALFSGLSRATINELERGSLGELGVSKLSAILSVIDLDLGVTEKRPMKSALSMASATASASYKDSMSPKDLLKAMVTGTYPPNLLPHIATLLDEAPLPIIVSAVKQAAEKSGVAPKKVWRNLKHWAEELKSPRHVWR
jgi:transcriptional regulator with XRE-family HTH domain